MKKLFLGMLFALLFSFPLIAKSKVRLSKKDKDDLMQLIADPVMQNQRIFDQLNSMVQQVQNFIIQVSGNDQDAKECCGQILAHLVEIELILGEIADLLEDQTELLGYLDDESFGEQDFNSVSDIDEAELSVISWLKTIYRELLKDKFIS